MYKMSVIEHIPDRYHVTFGKHAVFTKIKTMQPVKVKVPDCDGIGSDGKQLGKENFHLTETIKTPANPCAGPYRIEGAEIGDTLVVKIKEIKIDRNFGRTGLSEKQIKISADLLESAGTENNLKVPQEIVNWEIDTKHNIAKLELKASRKKEIVISLAPFIGCIAVAPDMRQNINSLACGRFGGNMDIPMCGIGSSIHLPVYVPGGYLFLGDVHAAQGDGEVIGGGIEVGGEVLFEVGLRKNKVISWPRIETKDEIGAVGTGRNLDEAMQTAFAQLILWLQDDYGFDLWEAMHLVSQTAKASPGSFETAVCKINKTHLP